MKILIATGIYPPQIGGPAQYAKEIKEALKKLGDEVEVCTYGAEKKLPTGLRHMVFLGKILPAYFKADYIIVLDTFSVALPVYLASFIFNKPYIVRVGGDFLWEGFIERTNKKVLLRNFYQATRGDWNLKEKFIFYITKKILRRAEKIVFTTGWQQDIWQPVYELKNYKINIIENYYGPKDNTKDDGADESKKIFLAGTRKLKWKNLSTLNQAFSLAQKKDPLLKLDLTNVSYDDFIIKMKQSQAVILVSLGDVSPNMILDAIRLNKPFILTRETGLYDRLKEVGLFVDPLNEAEIKDTILTLSNHSEYKKWQTKVREFNFVHTWEDIALEFKALML